MKTLTEELHDNNVIFSYYGFIDESVLNEVLRITKSKLEGNKESNEVVNKVSEVLRDCVDNIIKHNFYPEDSLVKYKSLLAVSKQGTSYAIDTINVVNEEQKKSIDENINYLHSKSKDELRSLRSKNMMQNSNTDTLTAPGLTELVLKADAWVSNFKKVENNYLFNIHFDINSHL
jgi:hypothetical protein